MAADLVRVIEAAYSVEQCEADWVSGICQAVRPSLDVGLGVIVATFDVVSGSIRFSSGAALGNSVEAFFALGRMQPHEQVEALRPIEGPPTKSLSMVYGDRLEAAVPELTTVTEHHGVRDVLAVTAMNPNGRGLCVAALLPRPTRPGRRFRARWDRIASHLAAGARLRRRVSPAEPPSEFRLRVEGMEALLTPDGRIAHAVGTATERGTREELRTAAIALDRARGALRRKDPDSAVRMWRALVDGRWSLVDRFDSDGRRFLVAERNEVPAGRWRGLHRREAAVLALRAQGHSIKLICYELGLGQSVVARALASGMKRLGFDSVADLARLRAGCAPESPDKTDHGTRRGASDSNRPDGPH